MIERPDLADETLAAGLQAAYGMVVQRIAFLPLGNDATAWAFRVQAAQGRAFFLKVKDTAIFIAAADSPSGGSVLALELCQGRRYTAACSQRVLLEAQTNIRDKLPREALTRFTGCWRRLHPSSFRRRR